MRRLIAACGVAVAVWPVWGWYAARLTDRSDEPWCLAALLTAAALLIPAASGPHWCRGALMVLLYAAAAVLLPPVFRCAAAFLALGMTLAPRGPVAGLAGLLILSAPLASSLDFYLGFPLRSLVAMLSAASLGVAGVTVRAEGTLLAAGERIVEVDAPCSGVRMLWTGLYLTFTLAALHRLPLRKAAAAASASVAIVIAGNVLRASTLFLLETGSWRAPEFTHTAVGLVVFVCAGLSIFAVHSQWKERAA